MLLRTGVCFDQKISVLALGFVLVGHATHHANIIRERYLPLFPNYNLMLKRTFILFIAITAQTVCAQTKTKVTVTDLDPD